MEFIDVEYNQVVGDDEQTLRFYQEIYDNDGNLIEIHEKYPVDRGHKEVRRESKDKQP